jgi:PEP-CTERM motif
MKLRFLCLTAIALCLGVIPATAQVDLYDDGPTNGTTDAWTFNFGFTPSDSFTFSSRGQISGLEFAAWLTPGDVLQSVEVTFTSMELGGTVYFDQQVNTTQSGCVVNQYAYNVCTETAMFNGPTFNAGTYWMTLQNGVVANGDPVYWDENSGPSSASVSYLGTIPAESFTLLGSTTSTTGTTPEPGTLILFGSGALGFVGVLRRKFGR